MRLLGRVYKDYFSIILFADLLTFNIYSCNKCWRVQRFFLFFSLKSGDFFLYYTWLMYHVASYSFEFYQPNTIIRESHNFKPSVPLNQPIFYYCRQTPTQKRLRLANKVSRLTQGPLLKRVAPFLLLFHSSFLPLPPFVIDLLVSLIFPASCPVDLVHAIKLLGGQAESFVI